MERCRVERAYFACLCPSDILRRLIDKMIMKNGRIIFKYMLNNKLVGTVLYCNVQYNTSTTVSCYILTLYTVHDMYSILLILMSCIAHEALIVHKRQKRWQKNKGNVPLPILQKPGKNSRRLKSTKGNAAN